MNEWEWQLLEERTQLTQVNVGGVDLKQGDRVRLRPRGGGDILDIALAGKTATIESIEQDYEDKVYLAVILDDDPGRDMGMLRQPGHRFFFSLDEVEPLADGETTGESL
jgi:hypothetical protein